jgi:hypothetical protein
VQQAVYGKAHRQHVLRRLSLLDALELLLIDGRHDEIVPLLKASVRSLKVPDGSIPFEDDE